MLRKSREGIDVEGNVHDLLELAAGGWVPDETVRQIEEPVAPGRHDF
jgi:hypothetical protein